MENFQGSTTFNDVPVRTGGNFHPSIFQTPALDIMMNNGTSVILNPSEIWQKKMCLKTAGQTVGNPLSQMNATSDPSDPPMQTAEVEYIRGSLKPLFEESLANTRRTLLSHVFLSQKNLKVIEQNVTYVVFKWSGHYIGRQSEKALVHIMQEVFDNYSRNVDEKLASRSALLNFIRSEVSRLDELVVQKIVPDIIDGIEQHLAFLKQQGIPREADSLSRPVNTKVTGMTVYRAPTDVLAI